MLEQCPGEALCDACLAFACSVSLTEMRGVTATLVRDLAFGRSTSTCASCRRQTPTLLWRGPDASNKCAYCSREIEGTDNAVLIDADAFHDHCWRRLTTDATVRASRALGEKTQALIRQSRERIGRSQDGAVQA